MSTNPVPYRVECRMTTFFEVIAAFNHEGVAKAYATDCQVGNQGADYRVTKRGKVLHDHVYITGAAIIQAKLGREAK